MARRFQRKIQVTLGCDFLLEDEEKGINYCEHMGHLAPLEESDLENRCIKQFGSCIFYQIFKSERKRKPEPRCELLVEDEERGIIYCEEIGPKTPLKGFDLFNKCGNRFYVTCEFFRHYIKKKGENPDAIPMPDFI